MTLLYSGLHLYEEAVLGFPLPLRERDRVRGKAVATNLLIQTKSAVRQREETENRPCRSLSLSRASVSHTRTPPHFIRATALRPSGSPSAGRAGTGPGCTLV